MKSNNEEYIEPLQDYIAQVKNCVLVYQGASLFEGIVGVQNPRKLDEPKKKRCNEIKNYIIKNNWIQNLMESYIEILPEAIRHCENLRRIDQDRSFKVLSALVNSSVRWTLNLWEVFSQVCYSLSQADRQPYLDEYLTKNIVNYVRMG